MKRILAVAACLALAVPSCSDLSNQGSSGRTQFLLTDAPFPYDSISAVNVYIARIDASQGADTSSIANPASWITVATPERAFNLLDLQQGATALLGEADLPPSQYSAVRMVINTTRSSIVRKNGSQASVNWPVAGELTLHALVEDPLFVGPGGARVVIDFDVGRSFLLDLYGTFTFIPYIRAVNDAATGSISGTIALSNHPSFALLTAENTAIEVYGPYGSLRASGRASAVGSYVIPYLRTGTYRVEAYPPGYPWLRGSVSGVEVTAGQVATVNIVISPDSTGGGACCDSILPPPDTTNGPPPPPPPPDTTTNPGGGSGPVHHLTLTPPVQTAHVGDSISVLAVPKDSLDRDLQGRTITWAISDTTVVRTIWQGAGWILLRALKPGSATLTATSEGKSGTATVNVQ